MTDEERHGSTPMATAGPELSDGRYLYCVVGLDGARRDQEFDTEGVDGEPVSIVTENEGRSDGDVIGAVVHACDELYDAADPRIVRQWLVQHQRVVDEAASQFGTPIPFQFDTILRGGDDSVSEWLGTERDTLLSALGDVAGTNEYRIEVVRTDPIPESAIERDDDLAALESKIGDASEGRAHLLRKQYEQELTVRRRERDRELRTDLRERIDGLVSTLRVLDRRPSVSLEEGKTDSEDNDARMNEGDGRSRSERESEDDRNRDVSGEPVCRFAVLATDDEADKLGSYLDSVAGRDRIAVRFTGPWPPYSFVPSFDSSADEEVN